MRDPWRTKLDNMNGRRRGSGWTRHVKPIRAARQDRHERPAPPRKRSLFYGFLALSMLAAFAAPIAIQSSGLVDLNLGRPGFAIATSPADKTPPYVIPVADAATRQSSSSIGFCPPEYRRGGGGVSCVTDGDSGVKEGEPWRLVASSGGVDAPEVGSPECGAERSAGERAKSRLRSLMSGGYEMSGWRTDRYGRRLVMVTLADGQDAGSVLLDEGLAQPWSNNGNPWCE